MFGKKKEEHKTYDAVTHIPILKCSICTGEKVAGFKDKRTGKFEDIMLIKSDEDLKRFQKMYHVKDIQKEY